MATLTEFFDAEAKRYIDRLTELASAPSPDAGEVYRNARGLRGSAQMAREDRVYRTALALEAGARALLQGALALSAGVTDRMRESVAEIDALVKATGREDAEMDALSAKSVQDWENVGVAMPAAAAGDVTHSPGRDAVQEFRAFAATEVEGIAEALDRGIQALSDNSMDREALKTILRRQRALLGAARLDEIPVVAELLRAVEDLTRVIAKLDVGVKREWLDIYRVAREGLKGTIEPLRSNEDPESSHSLARLRHMRAELIERYGSGEAVSTAGGPEQGLVQAQPMPDEKVVDIQELQYRGHGALEQVAALRVELERLTQGSPAAKPIIDEIFDLIELAKG
jgi:chemotaxis protein histidine kinase CheA